MDVVYSAVGASTASIETDEPPHKICASCKCVSVKPTMVSVGIQCSIFTCETDSVGSDVVCNSQANLFSCDIREADVHGSVYTTHSFCESAANLDDFDESYEPTESSQTTNVTSQQSQSDSGKVTDEDFAKEPKYIVFEHNLEQLTKFCFLCGSLVTEKYKFIRGSLLGIKMVCLGGCSVTWHSQPMIRGMPVGNLLLLIKFSEVAETVNLAIMSSTTFY